MTDYFDPTLTDADNGGMTDIGVARLIGHCQRIGILARLTDQREAVEQVHSWARVIPPECTLLFAVAVADTWEENRPITPIAIKSRWDDHVKAQRASMPQPTYDEAACAWARVCHCQHTECYHGQMREAEDKETVIDTPKGPVRRYTTGVRWCPRCWDARNTIRVEHGKEPREYGDMRP